MKLRNRRAGTRLPLAISWPARVPGERTVEDFVSFVDFAPTLLEAVGLTVLPEMTGRSFLKILLSESGGRINQDRDHVLLGRERHVAYRPGGVGYPARAIRSEEFLYIQNLSPERWPAGDPPYFVDIDRSPSKFWVMLNRDRDEVKGTFERAFLKRPSEELYDLRKDPWQQRNLAQQDAFAPVKARLAAQLHRELVQTGDPRALGRPVSWDRDPYYGRNKEDWLKDQVEQFEAFKKILGGEQQ